MGNDVAVTGVVVSVASARVGSRSSRTGVWARQGGERRLEKQSGDSKNYNETRAAREGSIRDAQG